MGSRILERLRRHHAADFREGRDLAVYVSRKTLAFLEFDPAWILTRETLDNAIVEAHVARLLDEVLGEDQAVALPSSRGLVESNRKSVRDFTTAAISVVRAWCRRNRSPVPQPWTSDEPQVRDPPSRERGAAGLRVRPGHAGSRVVSSCRLLAGGHAADARPRLARARPSHRRRGKEASRGGTPTKSHREAKH